MEGKNIENLEYTRRVYDNVLSWYKSADSKAQVILAIDGGFIAFVSSTVFAKPEDLLAVLRSFNSVTWIFLVLMMISLLGSIGSSINCLWSRIYSNSEIRKIISEAIKNASSVTQSSESYPPTVTNFFQFIEHLDVDRFGRTLKAVDQQFELEALTSQIHILSGHVRKKHFAVNIGFLLAAMALIMFFAVAVSYTLTVL